MRRPTAPHCGSRPAGDYQPWAPITHPETPDAPAFDMSITVGENTAREMSLTRTDVDE